MFKRILFLFLAVAALTGVSAQVTSSSIAGNVRSASGESLVGATVKAIHVPTGTVYTTQTCTDGVFNIVNMIPGGPYKIETSFVGYSTDMQSDLVLPLGEIFVLMLTSGPRKKHLLKWLSQQRQQ